MTIFRPAISLALLLVSTASLAADPPVAEPKAPTETKAAPAPAAAANTTPAAPIGPAVAAAPDAAATAKAAHALGYSQKQRSGKTVFCKAEASLGTRLESMKCFSEEEITAVVLRSQQNQDSVAKMQRTELYEEDKH